MRKHAYQAAGIFMLALSTLLLVLSFLSGFGERTSSAITFNGMAISFALVFYLLPEKWRWKYWLLVPLLFSLTTGLVLVLNAVTNSDTSWAFAWMLLVASLAAGTAVAVRQGGFHRWIYLGSLGIAAGFSLLFAFFGMLFGGAFMRIMVLIILGMEGGLLLWMGRRGWTLEDWLQTPTPHSPGISPEELAKSSPLTPLPEQLSLPDSPDASPLVEELSKRELEVLRLVETGLTNTEIAARMTIAPSTVKTHINNIFSKLAVQTRVQAVRRAKDLRLL